MYKERVCMDVNAAVISHVRSTFEAKQSEGAMCDSWLMSLSIRAYDPADAERLYYFSPKEYMEDDEGGTTSDWVDDEVREAMSKTPTHVVRLVDRTCWDGETLVLVDGTQYYVIVSEDGSVESVWEYAWEGNQPDYYGGPIPEAIEWVCELGPEVYSSLYPPAN
jgi:hypothetical protein